MFKLWFCTTFVCIFFTDGKQQGLNSSSELINKEEFKTRTLRKTYGDACLKVVVKKCYKASKKAVKSGCANYKCTSSFKNKFQQNARVGCIREFRENQEDYEMLKKKKLATGTDAFHTEPVKSNHSRNSYYDEMFMDFSRSGYLAAACLSSVNDRKPLLRSNDSMSKSEIQLNVLRDRYEKECQRVSAEKCENACKYALRQTCDTNTCISSKERAISKKCKSECETSYKSHHRSSRSSRSSSGSSSGSGSSSSSHESRQHSSKRPIITFTIPFPKTQNPNKKPPVAKPIEYPTQKLANRNDKGELVIPPMVRNRPTNPY